MTSFRCTLCHTIYPPGELAANTYTCPVDGAPLVPHRERVPSAAKPATAQPMGGAGEDDVDDLEIVDSGKIPRSQIGDGSPVPVDPDGMDDDGDYAEALPVDAPMDQNGSAAGVAEWGDTGVPDFRPADGGGNGAGGNDWTPRTPPPPQSDHQTETGSVPPPPPPPRPRTKSGRIAEYQAPSHVPPPRSAERYDRGETPPPPPPGGRTPSGYGKAPTGYGTSTGVGRTPGDDDPSGEPTMRRGSGRRGQEESSMNAGAGAASGSSRRGTRNFRRPPSVGSMRGGRPRAGTGRTSREEADSRSGAGDAGHAPRSIPTPPPVDQQPPAPRQDPPPTAASIGKAANAPIRKTPTKGIPVSQLSEDPDEFPPGPFGPFDLLKILGRGAMGTVYLADWPEVKDPVAVKVLSQARTQETRHRKRFQREAEICKRLRHPNLVEVYEIGEADGRLYMAMEYINGRPISAFIREKGTLEANEIFPVVIMALNGVQAFHAAEIIHRDLKPDNILVRNDGVAKVSDFGLALLQEPDVTKLTAAGKAVGTPYFMAPEQVLSPETVDHRVDIYAMGITVYHALTASYPYEGRRANDVLLNIAREQPIHIWSRRADLPQPVAQVVMRMIARDPNKRFADAAEASIALQDALSASYG